MYEEGSINFHPQSKNSAGNYRFKVAVLNLLHIDLAIKIPGTESLMYFWS